MDTTSLVPGEQPAIHSQTAGERNLDHDAPFFLVGAERSGTTLLRLMLDHHPLIRCGHESDFLVDRLDRYRSTPPARLPHAWEDNRAYAAYRRLGLPAPAQVESYDQLVAWLFRALREQSGKLMVGVTVHWHAYRLPAIVADARYVHLLRDGRAVATSVVQMGWAGNAYHGALYWKRAMEQVLRLRTRVPATRWLDVRYEDLLRDPPSVLGRVCAFLRVEYDERMLRYPDDSTYDAPDPANAERWRRRMQPRDIYYAEMAAGELLEQLGYEAMFPPAAPTSLERLALRVANRIGRMRFAFQRYGAHLILARKAWRLLGVRRSVLEARYQSIRQAYIK